jgi:aspartyl-tRNA(Asn)/glutamyl-tRNA(Gln) amidotransferase subunit B
MIVNELFGALKESGIQIEASPIAPWQLAKLVRIMHDGDVSSKQGKDLFKIMWSEEPGGDPAEVAAARGMKQVTDTGAIEAAVDEIIAANPAQVEKAKANPKLAGWFTGQVIKATGGKANPAAVGAMVAAKLGL